MDFTFDQYPGGRAYPVLTLENAGEVVAVEVAALIRRQQIHRLVPKFLIGTVASRLLLGGWKADEARHLGQICDNPNNGPTQRVVLSDEHAAVAVVALHNLATSEGAHDLARKRFGTNIACPAFFEVVAGMNTQITTAYNNQDPTGSTVYQFPGPHPG